MLWDIWFLLLILITGSTLLGVARWGLTDGGTTAPGDSTLVTGGFSCVPLRNRHRVHGRHRAW
ncbi:hypothetical protein ACWELJ_02475 [Nocardia sp. NPDC004582]